MSVIQSVEATKYVEGNSNFMIYSNVIVHLEPGEENLLSTEEVQKDLQSKFEMLGKIIKTQTRQIEELKSLLKQKGITQ